MDEEYDYVVLGTGFIECVLSGLLSVDGNKVLHMDRNNYYGGESASLNLDQLCEKFGQEKTTELGRARDFNVDLIPKFIMSTGKLVKILLHTDVTRYCDFKVVDGSYVYQKGKVHKVPVTQSEALTTGLVGLMSKNALRKFLVFCMGYSETDPATHQGMDLDNMTMADVFKRFKLDQNVSDFIGHALALYPNDEYLTRPCKETFERMALYSDSLNQYGKSPYLYVLYGLGELPQGFSRLAAIYGGTFMLDKQIDEIVTEGGKFVGVKSGGETVKAKAVIGDPSYFKEHCEKRGQVARCICILSHPIPSTNNNESCQIIIPGRQVGRKHDIYVASISYAHNVAPEGKWLAIVATEVESNNPEKELEAGLALLGPIDRKFFGVSDMYAPKADIGIEGVHISDSYDASTHFESACANIMKIYKDITGKDVDLTPAKPAEEG